MSKVQEPTASRIRRQALISFVAAMVVTSVVAVSGVQLEHELAADPTFVVLHTFAGSPTDGASPYAGLVLDPAGNLYGTTGRGGSGGCNNNLGCGTVFKVSSTGAETVLHSFTGGADGETPLAGLIRDRAGNLFGTTNAGGAGCPSSAYGCGVVFELGSNGTEKVLYSFAGGADGANPTYAGLIRDASSNFYGTTAGGGGSTACPDEGGCGTVFKLSPRGAETVLYRFTGGADGAFPAATLIRDGTGNLYGTAPAGGAQSSACPGIGAGDLAGTCGVVFELSPTGAESVLHSFTGEDGANPLGGLIQDAEGNLYGTAQYGGASGNGVVFELVRGAAGYDYRVLYSFTGGADGGTPSFAGLIRGRAGDLYGTTLFGGASSACPGGVAECGTVFRLGPTGTETVLHSFSGGADGESPVAGLVRDADGNLYGTAPGGGSGRGVVFRLSP
jgi:uncharacterized repeat protein (TIGR03803 family)